MALLLHHPQLHLPKRLLLLVLLTSAISIPSAASASPSPPLLLDRYILRRSPAHAANSTPTEYIDPTLPPIVLPIGAPNVSLLLLSHDFAYTYDSPPAAANFTLPDDLEWSRAVLEFSASCAGEQYDRIAAVWIDGIEVLRTSTAEPTEAGVFWSVRKDVSRYAAVLRPVPSGEPHNLTVMLENIVNDVYTGIYHVNVSLDLYGNEILQGQPSGKLGTVRVSGSEESGVFVPRIPRDKKEARKLASTLDNPIMLPTDPSSATNLYFDFDSLYKRPADLILPISYEKGEELGFWFRIQGSGEVRKTPILIPQNTYRAKLEVYVSYHGDDEFWYSNPPTSYISQNHLPTGRGNGSFRRVVVTVDGIYVGSVFPFPVVFTGGVNPLFWEPVVSIGAFDLPSYELELTPFLGSLLDGQTHEVGISVDDAISFWLVDANLHLWLDPEPQAVTAGLISYKVPSVELSRESQTKGLDGEFEIEAEGEAKFSGWVNCSLGNVTYKVEQEYEFESKVEYKNSGNKKKVSTKSKTKTKIDMKLYRDGVQVGKAKYHQKLEFPISLTTETIPSVSDSKYKLQTYLSHQLYEDTSIEVNKFPVYLKTVDDKQSGEGWMEVEDHSVLAGSTSTTQTYMYVGAEGCFFRNVTVADGVIQNDLTSSACAFSK